MKNGFWKDRRVLITGHEGFLGSNLTRAMLERGAVVNGLDILVRRRKTLFTPEEYRKINVIKGSVTDFNLLKRLMTKVKPEVIFHLAAEAIVGKCNSDPVCGFKSNIEGTWNILEASRIAGGVAAIVLASSDKAYGCHKELPYTEKAPLIGRHPYDVSKSCADLIAYTYFYTFGLPVAVTRCGNIYGPGDFNFSRIVPDAIRCAIRNRALKIRSDGRFTRDYVYVQDIVNGYILLAEQLKKKNLGGEAFNFSDENPITVIDFIKQMYAIIGRKPNYTILNTAKYEIKHQYLDSKKARKVLNWKPRFALHEGMRRTIDWYQQYYKNDGKGS